MYIKTFFFLTVLLFSFPGWSAAGRPASAPRNLLRTFPWAAGGDPCQGLGNLHPGHCPGSTHTGGRHLISICPGWLTLCGPADYEFSVTGCERQMSFTLLCTLYSLEARFGTRQNWVWSPAMPLLSCVTPASDLTSLSISFLDCMMAIAKRTYLQDLRMKSSRAYGVSHGVGTQMIS